MDTQWLRQILTSAPVGIVHRNGTTYQVYGDGRVFDLGAKQWLRAIPTR